jgi:serine/threonine protein kinase
MPAATELLQKGRYRIDSSAPSAASGTVHHAYDTTSETNVYVKEVVVRLNKVTTLSQQENSRLAFENAAKRISAFQHEALLQVKDFYSEVGRQYLVLENVDGEDLHSILEADKQPSAVEKVLDWADQLLDAANYLHNQKPPVIHRNICPRNIKLQSNGKVKLLGVTIKDDSGNDVSTALTEVSDGSLNFLPLELFWNDLDAASQKVIINSYDDRSEKILKEPADVRSDIYSIGATLYYLLTARVPLDPLERSIELLEGNKDPLAAPNAIDTRIAPEISDVVMRALEIKRENRYDSAMIMRQVLRTAVVKVKEREAAEAQEMQEAAEVLRGTQQLKMPAPPAPEPTPAPTRPAQPTEAEILAQKLKEAEEMRLEAERRAAEAERLLREQEAEKARLEELAKAAIHASTEPPAPAVNDDDLLGITAEPMHVSNPPAHDVDDEIHLSIRPEPRAKIDLRTVAKAAEPAKPVVVKESVKPEPVQETKQPEPQIDEDDSFLIDVEPEPQPIAKAPAPVEYELGYEEPKRSGLPIPLIAGVAAVILIAAALGFVFLGGSSSGTPAETQTAAPAPQPQQVQQPVAVPEQPAATAADQPEQPVNAFNETPATQDPQPQAEQPSSEQRTVAKPAQTPKPKVAEPAKTPAPKKAVTVDDLINDN